MSEAVATRCPIEQVFDAGFIELLRLVPRNPLVLALILKFTGKMPGGDCESFEQLKEWVEANCKPRSLARRTGQNGVGISIPVDFAETEYGRADYTVRCTGREEFRVDDGDLLEMVQTAIEDGSSIDDVVERIAEKIDDDAWNQCEPDMDSDGEYEYTNHDQSSTDDPNLSYSRSHIRQAVLTFLRDHHPELSGQL